MRESWLSVKTAVKTIWPVGTEKRKWSLKISCVWEVLFAEIEFELGQTEEVGKNRNIFQVRWIMRVRIVSTTLQYSYGWRVSGKNSGRWGGQDLGAQTYKHGQPTPRVPWSMPSISSLCLCVYLVSQRPSSTLVVVKRGVPTAPGFYILASANHARGCLLSQSWFQNRKFWLYQFEPGTVPTTKLNDLSMWREGVHYYFLGLRSHD